MPLSATTSRALENLSMFAESRAQRDISGDYAPVLFPFPAKQS